MQRETKKFTTSKGNEIEIKTYLTGGESNSVKEGLYNHMRLNKDSGDAIVNDIPGVFLLEQEKKILSIVLVSVKGKTEDLVSLIENLPNDEYQEIVAQVNEVYKGNLASTK